MNLLASIERSAIGIWIRESEWGYPIVLICHTLGMALLAGVTLALAIRTLLMGAPAALGFGSVLRLAWLGFAISLVSGSVLFAGGAQRFSAHPAFQIKLAALTAASALLFAVSRQPAPATPLAVYGPGHHRNARWLSGASILLWLVAIAAGRLMAYIR